MLLLVLLGMLAFATAPVSPVAPVAPVAAPLRVPEAQMATGRFTTALEVRPILDATRASWVAVREYEGQDLLYFTGLMAWRCGLWEVRYGLNGAAPETPVPLEPCHDDTAQPNAMVDVDGVSPYITAPLQSIQSVEVVILLDDGTEDGAVYARQSVLMP